MIINEILEALSPEEGSLDVLVVDNEELGSLVTVNDTLGALSAEENESLPELIPENARFVSGQDIFLYVPRAKTNTRYGLVKYNARDFSIDSTGVLSLLLDASQIQDYFAEIRGGTREETVAATPPINLKTLHQKDELLASEITTLYSRDGEIYGTLGRQGTVLSGITLSSLSGRIDDIILDTAPSSSTSHTYSAYKINQLLTDVKTQGLHFTGFIGETVGEDAEGNAISKEGALWYQSDETTVPESPELWSPIYKCIDGQWVEQSGYTPEDFDIWKNINIPDDETNTWWYFEGTFEELDFSVDMSLYYTKIQSDERYKSKFTYGSYVSEVNKVLTIDNMNMPTAGSLTSFVKGNSDLESTNVQDAIKELETNTDSQYFILSSRSNWIDNDVTPLRAGDYSIKSDGIYESVSDGNGGYVWQLQTIDLSSLLSKSSANHNIVTDISYIVDANTGYVSEQLSYRNLSTGNTSTSSVSIPVATSEHDGMMPATSMVAISTLDLRVTALESGVPTYFVSFPSNTPSQEALTLLYRNASGSTSDPQNMTTLVDVDRNMYYRYFSFTTPNWQGPYTYSYDIADVGSPGLVSSSQQDGQIYVEPVTGVMSLNGYTGIINTFNTLYGGTGRTNIALSQVPDLPASKITSGTLSLDRLPVITVAKGGTGASTFSANKLLVSGSSDDGAFREGPTFGDLNTILVGQGSSTMPTFKTLSSMKSELQTAITDSTHRFVTDTEKSTWNSKQDALTAGSHIDIANDVISAEGGVYRGTFGTWNDVPSTTTGYEQDVHGNTTPLKNDYIVLNVGSGKLNDASFLYLSDTSGAKASIANTYNGTTQSVIYYNATGSANAKILNGVVSVYYDSGPGKWVITTLVNCVFNSVSYTAGSVIAQWGYASYSEGYINYDTNTNGGIFVYDGVWATNGKNGWKAVASILSMSSGLLSKIGEKQDALTQTQLNAVNSGIDSTKVAQITTNASNITNLTGRVGTAETNITNLQNSKQDNLTAGDNISIVNNVISAEKDIEEITNAGVRITDLDSGIYKLIYSNPRIYYNGTSGTNYITLASGQANVEAILVVNKIATIWTWYVIVTPMLILGSGQTYIYFGATDSSSGKYNQKTLKNIPNGIADNLTTNFTGYALDARQGYVLKGLIDNEVTARQSADNNKVDKTNQASKLYGTSSDGSQDLHTYSFDNANSWTFVQRDAKGDVFVPSTPTSNNGATSKVYVNTYNMCPSDSIVTYSTTPTAGTTLMTAPSNGVAYVRYSLSGKGSIGIHLRTSGNTDLAYNTQKWNDSGEHLYNATFVMKAGQKLYCYENGMSFNWGQINFIKSEGQ